MFGKLFGGPVVQLVAYSEGRVVVRSKRPLKATESFSLRVAGRFGKPARVEARITACREVPSGGYVAAATVADTGHRGELSRLGVYALAPDPYLRRWPRSDRTLRIDCPEFQGTAIDVSAGGMQVDAITPLEVGQTLKLELAPGLSCRSRVAWVNGARAGLAFQFEDDVTRMLVQRFAEGRSCNTSSGSAPARALGALAPPAYQTVVE